MSVSTHHRSRLNELSEKLGSVERLEELFYRINRMDNSWKLCKEYGVEMYELRYLMNLEAQKECVCFIHEKQHKQELKLVYFREAI